MPDIQFDSLIILLLVLASLFGRLFKKKEENAPPPPRQPREEHDTDGVEEDAPELRDVLRDFWEKSRAMGEQEYQQQHQTIEEIEEIPEESLVPSPTPIETFKDPTPAPQPIAQQKTSNQLAYLQKGETDHQGAATKNLKAFDIGSGKGNPLAKSIVKDLQSPDSLRKALVLREILGPPVSLRNGQTDVGL